MLYIQVAVRSLVYPVLFTFTASLQGLWGNLSQSYLKMLGIEVEKVALLLSSSPSPSYKKECEGKQF